MKKYVKAFLIIEVFLIILFVSGFSWCFSTDVKSNIKIYEKIQSKFPISHQVMPDIEDLPLHKDIFYQYRNKRELFFSSRSILLVVTYDEKTYQSEKKKIEKQYTFETVSADNDLSEPKMSDGITPYILPESKFYINSFNFRVIKESDKNDFWYPKYMGIIAVSEEEYSIAYLYFDDMDLDLISDSGGENAMKEFIITYYQYDW